MGMQRHALPKQLPILTMLIISKAA